MKIAVWFFPVIYGCAFLYFLWKATIGCVEHDDRGFAWGCAALFGLFTVFTFALAAAANGMISMK